MFIRVNLWLISKSPIKRQTCAMRISVPKPNPIGFRTERFISRPTRSVCLKITIFDADTHVFVDHETQPRKGLPCKDHISIASMECYIIDFQMIHTQNGG